VSCHWCAAGRANGARGQRSCKDCAAGRLARGNGAKRCAACPNGQTSKRSATSCRHLGLSWSKRKGALVHAKDDASVSVAGLDDINPAAMAAAAMAAARSSRANPAVAHGAHAASGGGGGHDAAAPGPPALNIDGDIDGDIGGDIGGGAGDGADEEHSVGIPVATGGRIASALCRAQILFGGWSACDLPCKPSTAATATATAQGGHGLRYRYKLRITCGKPPDELPSSKRFKQSKTCQHLSPCRAGHSPAKVQVKIPSVGQYR